MRVTLRGQTPSRLARTLNTWMSEFVSAAARLKKNNLTQLADILHEQLNVSERQLRSAEMALELRNSLTTISGYAQQLAASNDAELAQQLAADIAAEAAHLDHTIGGFLLGPRAEKVLNEFS